LGLARAELSLGRETDAARHIRACLEARPDDLEAWFTWLELLERQGDTAAIAGALERLQKVADEDGRLWLYRALVHQAQRDHAEAIAALRRAASLRPFDEQILYHLALAERQAGESNEAEVRSAQSKALGDARHSFFDALQAFSRAVTRTTPAAPELAAETDRLASLCDTLGLEREATVLRSMLPQF
jgi:tetratricopeptide (TPR) repeat protein